VVVSIYDTVWKNLMCKHIYHADMKANESVVVVCQAYFHIYFIYLMFKDKLAVQ